jgi:hypothetical protein
VLPDDRRPTLRPPQFGLRSLLLLVTAFALLFGLSPWLPPVTIAAILFLAATIFCHVAGNALGTKLRANGDRPLDSPSSPAIQRRPTAEQFAPATKLSQRSSLGWTIIVATLTGTVAGGVGGGLWTWLASRGPVGPVNVLVGVVAFASLGGLAAFMTVGFTQVLLGAMWQALRPPQAGERE